MGWSQRLEYGREVNGDIFVGKWMLMGLGALLTAFLENLMASEEVDCEGDNDADPVQCQHVSV